MMTSMKDLAHELVEALKKIVDVLIETAKEAGKAAKNVQWWTNINLTDNWVANWFTDAAAATVNFVSGQGEWWDGIETIGNSANTAANQLANLNNELQKLGPRDTFFSGTGGSFASDLEMMNEELAAFDEQWQALADAKPIMLELPKWQKFMDENKTPLQAYQAEIEKLNMMLDGSEEGFQAFAIGSANALQKLKQATGLGGEQKFASAITKGSAEDFKATLDAQNQNVDVQQQIRDLMEQAAIIQQAQLDAQIQMAQAIQANRPNRPVNVLVN